MALAGSVDRALKAALIREDGQEDLIFGLWTPSDGRERFTALVHTVVHPGPSDRQVHGNASFNPEYFEHVCRLALNQGCGISFMHSHPFPGWQGMSADDVRAEEHMAPATTALTGLPLLGMTIGENGVWSARIWEHAGGRRYERCWCTSVRSVGQQLVVHYPPHLARHPQFREAFRRTLSVWGEEAQRALMRLRIGVVGLGSVGALVVETLARMGIEQLVLIDFDRVKRHNLDRLVIATEADLGRLKVDVAADRVHAVATAGDLDVSKVPFSVVEEEGYRAALDCDILVSCVDRPRPRSVLDHMAYAHLIPVIDGGVMARFKKGRFSGVDWQVQTVGPGRACLECLHAYDPGDASTEAAGKLDDPSYLAGLPTDHRFHRNENVFPFCANLASLEVLQLVALATGTGGITDFGVQRYRYIPGIIDQTIGVTCRPECGRDTLTGRGDQYFNLVGRDLGAEAARSGSPGRGP